MRCPGLHAMGAPCLGWNAMCSWSSHSHSNMYLSPCPYGRQQGEAASMSSVVSQSVHMMVSMSAAYCGETL